MNLLLLPRTIRVRPVILLLCQEAVIYIEIVSKAKALCLGLQGESRPLRLPRDVERFMLPLLLGDWASEKHITVTYHPSSNSKL